MNEELEFILDRVHRHDTDRSLYKEMADRWEKMWKLDPGFTRPLLEALDKGHEQVILPTPFNVVNLSQRLLSSTPRIDVIPQDIGNRESENYAEQCEKWLTQMWRVVNRQQQRNVVADNIWNALVYGRFVFDVRWIKENLPLMQRKTGFPIAIRALNPKDVGIQMGPYGPEFAYHKYTSSLLEVVRKWPDLKDSPKGSRLRTLLDQLEGRGKRNEDHEVEVIDYWAMDPDEGTTWNAIIVEDEFAKEFAITSYPTIPIICGRGDFGIGLGDEFDGLSILHSIDGLWQYQCRLVSQMATGLYWYFWPQFLISNENNLPVEDFEPKPGGVEQVPPGTKVDQVTMNPNVPLAQAVNDQLTRFIEQSTYPEVMFGQAPADLKAGYGVALLSDAAQGRIKNFQESLEMAIMHVNELVLALVEKKGGTKGVDIYGVDEVSDEKYKLNLNKKMIGGVYTNQVKITPAMPTDDLQKTIQGKQLADGKYISSQTFRDKWVGIKVPTDETRRIALEELMQSDELRTYRLRKAAEDYFGEDAPTILFGTPFMMEPPEGYEWYKDEDMRVKLRRLPPQPPSPMPPPGGPPPGPPGQPPMGGPPPGGPPGMPPGGGPPMPPPGGPPMQPPGVAGPLGGGVPPQLAGQMEGENLGMDPSMDPLLFDMLMNQGEGPQTQMNQTIGLQP